MDRHVPVYRGTYLDWRVSPSLSSVAEVYSLAMLHYSGMAGPEMFDCSVFSLQKRAPLLSSLHLPRLPAHLAAASCRIGALEREREARALLRRMAGGTLRCFGGVWRGLDIDSRCMTGAANEAPPPACPISWQPPASPRSHWPGLGSASANQSPTDGPCLSMTSGWHHWKGIKVIKGLLVQYSKGQGNIKPHQSEHTQNSNRGVSLLVEREVISPGAPSPLEKLLPPESISSVVMFWVYLRGTPCR